MSQLWTEIFNSNRWIPPALSRLTADGTASDCYAISIKGAEIPKLDSHCQYQLRACFYDAAYHTFFGKPWQSRWIDGRQRLTFDETLFFHTKFKEQAVVVVLELVARNVAQAGPNNDTPTSSAEQLVGWTVVRHYKLGRAIVDFSHQGPQFTKYLLNAGTPKILLLIQEPIDDNPQLLKSAGNIDVAIQTHRLLARALDFVPDNSIFGFMDIVPGLESAKRGSALANPVPREPAPSCVDSLSVTFGPHAERLEAELCDLINRDRLFKDNKRLADHKDDEMVVLERRIRVNSTFFYEIGGNVAT
uniref:Uncharacterized protein n=1 Tax=Plectus sambesii TaxID=2011161 RepID=A0A914W6U8_9BILA